MLLSSTGTTPNNYLYTGEEFDSALGFYYLRARYYSNSTGRFTTGDPFAGRITDPVSLHRYLYAADNPVNLVDPGGRQFDLPSLMVTSAIYSSLAGMVVGGISNGVKGAIIGGLAGLVLGPITTMGPQFDRR